MASTVQVGIIIRAKNFATGVLKRFNTSLRRTASLLSSVRFIALSLFAGFAIKGVKSLVNLGAAAEETTNFFNTVFGKSAKEVEKFNNEFGKMAGLSTEAGRDVLATAGSIAQGMGFAQESSAAFAQEVVKLTGDLASFRNLNADIAFEKITAALTGEFIPLKRLGFVIRAADVTTQALVETGKTHISQLTQQEKATATLTLITERMGVAVGDLERTQGSFQNRMRRLQGDLKDVRDRMGEIVVRALEQANFLGETGSVIDDLAKSLRENRDEWILWGTFVVTFIKASITGVLSAVRVLWNVVQSIIQTGLAAAKVSGELLTGDLNGAKDSFDEWKESMVVNLLDVGEAFDDWWEGVKAILVAFNDARENIKTFADPTAVRDAGLLPPITVTAKQLTLWERIGVILKDTFSEAADEAQRFDRIIADIASTLLHEYASAVETAFKEFVEGSKSAGAAFAGAMLGAIAAVASAQGKLFLAESFAALARGLLGDPRGFAAAAKFLAASTAMFALAGSLGAVSSGGGGGRGGSSATADEDASDVEREQGTRELVFVGDFLDLSDPRQQDLLGKAIGDLTGMRISVRTKSGGSTR